MVLFIQLFSARAGSRTAHLPDSQQVGGLEATGDSDFAVLPKGLVAADSDVGSGLERDLFVSLKNLLFEPSLFPSFTELHAAARDEDCVPLMINCWF